MRRHTLCSMSKPPRLLIPALTTSLLLAGCSGSSAPANTPAPQAATSTHVKTPWDGLLKDRAKAKAVQQTVNAYAKRQQQAIKQATQ